MIIEFYPMSIESAVNGNKIIFSHEQWTSIRNTIDNIIERNSKTTNENQD